MNKRQFNRILHSVISDFEKFIIEKNEGYGNSAFQPINVMAKIDPEDAINVRMDDKLNKIINGKDLVQEDSLKNLVGYWFLREVGRRAKTIYQKESLE